MNAESFCSCIKKVRKSLKNVRRKDKEGRAIAICVKSVLQSRGRTLKKFKCRNGTGDAMLKTQKMQKKPKA
jgi:hypothetical protein